MKKCSKCGTAVSENDKMAWKCMECGKAFKINLSKLKRLQALKNKPENAGKSLLKCPACGKGIDNGNEKIACKCSACGNIMSGNLCDFADENVKNHTAENQAANMSFRIPDTSNNFIKCSNCGKSVPGNSKFCPECGNQISRLQHHNCNKSYKKAIILISFLFIIILTVSFSTVAIKNYKSRSYAAQLQTLYNEAKTLIENGQYQDAQAILSSVNPYKDSEQLLDKIKYESIAFYCIQDIANTVSNFNSFSVKKITFYKKEYRHKLTEDQSNIYQKYYDNLDETMPLILIEYRNNDKDYYAAYIYKSSNSAYNFYGLANTLNMKIDSIKEALSLLANTNESDARGMFNMAYNSLILEADTDISKINKIIAGGLANVNAVQILDIDAL